MAVKTLSGILVTRDHTSGRAVIDLSRNEIVDGDLGSSDLARTRIVAEPGQEDWYYREEPCNIVAMREFHVQFIDKDEWGSRPSEAQTDRLTINSRADETRLTVTWSAPSGSEVEEISYMVTGEAVAHEHW